MKFLFDMFPVIAFYITFTLGKKFTGEVNAMIAATGVLMVATLFQMSYTWIKQRKIERMHVVVLVLTLVFGGATIYFQDASFLIYKVTLVNWLFALAFLISHFIGNQLLIQHMLSGSLTLPTHVWKRLSFMWIGFFIVIGAINLLVAWYLELLPAPQVEHGNFQTWVNFKLFGMVGLTIIFIVLQGLYLGKYIQNMPPTEKSN